MDYNFRYPLFFLVLLCLTFFSFLFARGFEKNVGQLVYDSRIQIENPVWAFYQSPGCRFELNKDGFALVFYSYPDVKRIQNPKSKQEPFQILTEKINIAFINANPLVECLFLNPEGAELTYYTPEGPETGFRTNTYRTCLMKNVWPGIDAEFIITESGFVKYNWIVSPGADPGRIQWKIVGAESIASQDKYITRGTMGTCTEHLGLVYLKTSGKPVYAEYVVENNIFHYTLEAYAHSEALIIDPELVWSTYYGSPDIDILTDLKVLPDGSVVSCGFTSGTLFPVQSAFQASFQGNLDGVLLKQDAQGNRIWATYFGGSGFDKMHSLDLTSNGDIVICGETNADIPVSANCFQSTNAGGYDAFIGSFNPGGLRNWSTHFGGSSDEYGYGVCFDLQNRMYLTGGTVSSNLPAMNGFQQTKAGSAITADAFLVQFTISGMPGWGTYLGGNLDEYALDITADPFNRLTLTGTTNSLNFPVANAWQSSFGGGADIFITQVSVFGQLLWSTFVGGTANESGVALQSDPMGNILVCGNTDGSGFPVLNSYQNQFAGNRDILVMKCNANGQMLWADYRGGADADWATDISCDAQGRILVCGYSEGQQFPVLYPHQAQNAGKDDAVLFWLTTQGQPVWSGYLGGSDFDYAYASYINTSGDFYIGGITSSLDFPVLHAFQDTNATTSPLAPTQDIFISRFCQPEAVLSGTHTICAGSAHLSIQLSGAGSWDVFYSDGISQMGVSGISTQTYLLNVSPSVSTTYQLIQVYQTGGCGYGIASGQGIVQVVPSPPNAALIGQDTICTGGVVNLRFIFSGTGPFDVEYSDGVQSIVLTGLTNNPYMHPVSPSVHTTYSLLNVSSPCGTGIVQGQQVVHIDPIALPGAWAQDTLYLCSGDTGNLSVSLSGAQPWTLSWSEGVQTMIQSGISSAPFLIPVTGQYGNIIQLLSVENICGLSNLQSQTRIDTFPYPQAQFSFQTDTLKVQFTGSSLHTDSWHWSFGDAFTDSIQNPLHTYLNPGSYSVTLVSSNVCASDTLVQVITVSIPIGISKDWESKVLHVYPNPSNEYWNMQYSGEINQVNVYSALGQKVEFELISLGNSLYKLTLREYVKGIYFLEINQRQSIRLVLGGE